MMKLMMMCYIEEASRGEQVITEISCLRHSCITPTVYVTVEEYKNKRRLKYNKIAKEQKMKDVVRIPSELE